MRCFRLRMQNRKPQQSRSNYASRGKAVETLAQRCCFSRIAHDTRLAVYIRTVVYLRARPKVFILGRSLQSCTVCCEYPLGLENTIPGVFVSPVEPGRAKRSVPFATPAQTRDCMVETPIFWKLRYRNNSKSRDHFHNSDKTGSSLCVNPVPPVVITTSIVIVNPLF